MSGLRTFMPLALAACVGLVTACSSSSELPACDTTCMGQVTVTGWDGLPKGQYVASVCAGSSCGAFSISVTSVLRCEPLDLTHATWGCHADTKMGSIDFTTAPAEVGPLPLRVFLDDGGTRRTVTGRTGDETTGGDDACSYVPCRNFAATLAL